MSHEKFQLKKRAKDVVDALDQNNEQVKRAQQEKTRVSRDSDTGRLAATSRVSSHLCPSCDASCSASYAGPTQGYTDLGQTGIDACRQCGPQADGFKDGSYKHCPLTITIGFGEIADCPHLREERIPVNLPKPLSMSKTTRPQAPFSFPPV